MLFLATFCFVLYAVSTIATLYANVKKNESAGVIVTSIIIQALILYCLYTLMIML